MNIKRIGSPARITTNLIILILFLTAISCHDGNRIRIDGRISGSSGKMVYLEKIELEGLRIIDSLKIGRSEKFRFSTTEKYPVFYTIKFSERNFVTLLCEPGEKVEITGNAENLSESYNISGSEGSEKLKALAGQMTKTQIKLDKLFQELDSLELKEVDFEAEETIIQEIEKVVNDQRRFSIKFIVENLESMAIIKALYQKLDEESYVLNRTGDIQYLKIASESLSKLYPSSPHVMSLQFDAGAHLNQYEMRRLAGIASQGELVSYPDVAMPGINFDTIKISDLRQKYILLLFGSSLNSSSIRYNHELLSVYNDYNNRGFEIYHISVERSRDEWLEHIRVMELPWIHTVNLDETDFIAARMYNVQELPTSFLINKEVGVIERNISAADLRRRLSRVFD